MTKLAMLIPDWNSLDSVRHAHSNLEFSALLFFALLVLFDVLAHFSEGSEKERILERIGLCFFAVAVVAEIAAYEYGQRNDALSAQVISSLDAKAQHAADNASKALIDSGEAEIKSGTASVSASNALSVARGAHAEADSFERDIVSAKAQAADAESHLADALERAVKAEQESERLKEQLADRTLSDAQLKAIVDKLSKYQGQEYEVVAYWGSSESVGIANRVHFALQMAHWKFLPLTAWRGLLGGIVGIKINVHPNADAPTLEAAQELTLALQAEGLEASEERDNPKNPRSNIITLTIGSKR